MKNIARLFILLMIVAPIASARAQERAPSWAYPVNPPNFQRSPDDGSARHVPGSTVSYTLTQVRDLFATPDWHPDEHPPMPSIVATGRKPDVMACGVCHRADGAGGPENSSLSGLTAEYIVRQTQEFRSGQRSASTPRVPTDLMIKAAKALNDQELAEAAAYFSAIKPRANVKVVETDTAPKTEVRDLFLNPVAGSEREPIGQRIIELPESLADFVSRDTQAKFIAYVPADSIKRGEALATSKDTKCAACHGEGLKGSNLAPRLAGRSPTYLFRQLFDFKSGARNGINSGQMKPTVETLSTEEMISLAAYAGSLPL